MTRSLTSFQLWCELKNSLQAGGVPTPEEEASRVVAEVTRCDPCAIQWRQPVAPSEARAGRRMRDRRIGGTPIDYVVGSTTFCGLRLRVDERVLVPRHKTESLVTLATTILLDLLGRPAPLSVADIGTGCGAVALALLAALPHPHPPVTCYAVDCSPEALDVARENARTVGLAGCVRWRCGDLVAPLPEPVDLMVANLPYLPPAASSRPPREVGCEPAVAVFGGGTDGLATLRRFIRDAPEKLRADGRCVVEIPVDHGEALCRLAESHFGSAELVADHAGVPRLLLAGRTFGSPR
jgi:release factor glutamine methyltransferase